MKIDDLGKIGVMLPIYAPWVVVHKIILASGWHGDVIPLAAFEIKKDAETWRKQFSNSRELITVRLPHPELYYAMRNRKLNELVNNALESI